jgi:hypothetical protein
MGNMLCHDGGAAQQGAIADGAQSCTAAELVRWAAISVSSPEATLWHNIFSLILNPTDHPTSRSY